MDLGHLYKSPGELPDSEERVSARRKNWRRIYYAAGAVWFCTWGVGQFLNGVDSISTLLELGTAGAMYYRLYVLVSAGFAVYLAYQSHPKKFCAVALLGGAQMLSISSFPGATFVFGTASMPLGLLIATCIYFEGQS